jgi:hypothetical protein
VGLPPYAPGPPLCFVRAVMVKSVPLYPCLVYSRSVASVRQQGLLVLDICQVLSERGRGELSFPGDFLLLSAG